MDSISRHEQILRVFHLIDILFGARTPLSIAELKRELRDRGVIEEMSDKNLRRDVLFLEKFGYAIEQTTKPSAKGSRCAAWAIRPGAGRGELRPPTITLPELLSLVVAREFLAPLAGTFYWRGIGQLLAKLEAVATPELLAYAEAHKDGLLVHPRPATAKYASKTLSAVHRAIRNRVELAIRYTPLGSAAPKRYTIAPEAVVVYDGSLYIAGRRVPARGAAGPAAAPLAADAIRFFKLDRVTDAKPTSRGFEPGSETVASLLADSITLYRSSSPPRRFRIRIDEPRARWAIERPFHPRQRVRHLPDGGILLEIDRGWTDELVPQLLSLGEHVEVLEPADVRDTLAAAARRIVERHASAPAGRRGERPRPTTARS
ncbi:MAG: WYL domain-containing protein [Planctomycetia bacterium]|nr:WYL domain-containing protein [Planctomycetia bacterium]